LVYGFGLSVKVMRFRFFKFKVAGSGFSVWDFWDFGKGVQGSGFTLHGLGLRVKGQGFMAHGVS